MITIEIKKTFQITDDEIISFYDLFERVFLKKRTISIFRKEFCNTSKGYSYHAFAKDGNKVVGHNVYMPLEYKKDDVEFMLALSVDAIVDPEYRGHGIYKKLLLGCEEAAINDGCVLRIGFPNHNSYPIQVKKFGYTDVGYLDTFFLPCNPGVINKTLSVFKPFFYSISQIGICMGNLTSNSNKHSFKIHKNYTQYNKIRYNWFDGNYQTVQMDNFEFRYKVDVFKGIKAAFLIDFYPMSNKNFNKAIKYIFAKEKNNVFGIIYVGNLKGFQTTMIKIPYIFSPKKFHMVTKVLANNFNSSDIYDIRNWELNLSNFDLI